MSGAAATLVPPGKTPEQVAAKAILDRVKALEDATGNFAAFKTELEAIKTLADSFKGFDPKLLNQEIEKIKAGQASVREAIRRSKGGFYVSGIEDYTKQFSMVRACIAVKTRNWENAGFEKEIISQARAKAGHIIGQDSAGGSFVPDQVIPDIIEAIYTNSVLIALEGSGTTRVSVLDGLTGTPARIGKFDGGCIAYWIGEQDKYIESQVKTGNISLTPKKLGILTRLTDEMQRFASPAFENLLRKDMQRAAAKKIDYTMLYGLGNENQPRGLAYAQNFNQFAAQNKLPYDAAVITDAAGGELDFDGLMEMQGVLEDQDIEANETFAFISHHRYFRRLKQLKTSNFSGQTTEKPYLIGLPMLTDERLRALIGDWDGTTQIPTTNKPGKSLNWATTSNTLKFTDVVGGNWSEALFGRWSGTEIVDDGGTGDGFINDQTYVKMRTYCDAGFRQEKALVWCPDAQARP